MTLHRERAFEDEIVADMAAAGWLHDPDRDWQRVNRELALYPLDLADWVKASQPDTWDALVARHGNRTGTKLAERVRKELDTRGTLDVLRHGIDMTGAKAKIAVAQFRPPMGLNPETVRRYEANRLRVVRQVRYSTANENALDLVLFVNGVPTATLELKSDFTQSVADAEAQYRRDRDPQNGKGARSGREPMLSFPEGALVHFAVSNAAVRMTTRLEGAKTRFLPFDRGTAEGGAGNPTDGPDGKGGHPTAYLWRDVLAPDSWLELVGRTIIPVRDDRGKLAGQIFPRFHQLDVVRRIVADVRERGAGQRYLVQHSAGSGKTNSIAWTAHFLADLHVDDAKVFDTVIVVSDRKVIDGQLRAALESFERTRGVVETVLGEGRAKSRELAEALGAGKKIVVCTIQTFPFALDEVRRLAAAQGKTFAVIADEAHSSQTGQAAAKLREVLGLAEDAEAPDVEDILAQQMSARAGSTEGGGDLPLTYVAFTATPKAKTLELFGTPPDPSHAAGPDNVPRPFHLYSMRQAIAEGFILDVLRNYTPYDLAFKLAQRGKALAETEADPLVDRGSAAASLMRWVRLHPHNIAQKVAVVVEHYRANVADLLEGRAKAMVVVGSRLEAVRWKRAMDAYIAEKNYRLATLAAFSGEVSDPENGEVVTEHGINPDLRGRDIARAFDTPAYQLLIVADKFQTGFDQPLLCAMYVDRRLAGVQAVQTLSRLNRCHPGKDTTYVLDFANSEGEVLDAFSTYHGEATLADVSDPDQIFDLAARLDGAGRYDEHEMDRVVRAELDPRAKQSELVAAIAPVAERLLRAYGQALADGNKDEADALLLFRSDAQTYGRAYTFLSQIIDYGTTHLARREIFLRRLVPLLDFERPRETIDLSDVELERHRLIDRGERRLALEGSEAEPLQPMREAGTGELRDPETERLAAIIARMNELFGTDTTDSHKVEFMNGTMAAMRASHTLQQQAANNSAEQFANSPDLRRAFEEALIDQRDGNETLTKQVLADRTRRESFLALLLEQQRLYERLREAA